MAINNITLGEDQPLSNDLKPIKVGGEASILEISSPLPDGSDSGLFRVDGDLDITGTLKTKLSHDLIYDFDDEVNTLAQAKVDALIDSAPAALDTLNELAAALGDDASFATTVTNSIATKVGLTGDETVAGHKKFSDDVLIAGTAADTGTNDEVSLGVSGNSLRVYTNYGYVNIGPQNASWAHFYTDRARYYFNNPIVVDDGLISSYDEDLVLRRVFNDTSYNQITLGDDSFELKLDNTARLSVDGDGKVIIAERLDVGGITNISGTYLNVGGGYGSTGSTLDSSGNIQANGYLHVDGNVGIGNTSPNHLLHVGDDADASFTTNPDKAIQLSSTTNDHEIAYILYAGEGTNNIRSKYYVDDATKYVGWDSTHSTGWLGYEWKIAGSQSMTLDTSGNLELSGNLKASNLYSTENIYHTDDTHTRIQMLPDRFLIYAGNVEVLDYQEDGDSTLEIDNSGIADITFGGGNVFFGGSQGSSDAKVGIGTTSPSTELEVNGDITANELILSGTSAGISINSDSDTEIFFNTTNNANIKSQGSMYLLAAASQKLYLGANNANAQVALDNGKLGIGIDSPTTTLDVEGTVSYKHTAFTTAGPTDNVDVSDTTVLEVDTSSNNVTIGGFTGGVQGQILYIVKTDTANFIQLEHNEGGGSQDIFLTSGSDDRVVGYGGFTLYCNGTSWFSLSNPTGAADAG